MCRRQALVWTARSSERRAAPNPCGTGCAVCRPTFGSRSGRIFRGVQWRWPISRPLVGPFGGRLYEVRTTMDGNIFRVFFCIEGGAMVLLHGFMKKTQKTPDKEVALARARQKELKS
ncbi:MAG TPA: type II toxin-antitoxin system RelE/ParE family toxin [Polyangiaceae bacterium]|nr:type II toxin-antitoxin system RelE/ParE family toxin [Polyangiaceae bacterium]